VSRNIDDRAQGSNPIKRATVRVHVCNTNKSSNLKAPIHQDTKIPKEGSLDDSLAAVLKERAEALIILPYPPFGLRNSRRS